MPENLRFLNTNSAIFSVIAVLMLNTIGVSYNFGIFGSLGLSYFDFADTSDFLLAAFKSPIAFAFALFLAIISFRVLANKYRIDFTSDVFELRFYIYVLAVFFGLVVAPASIGYINIRAANEYKTPSRELNTIASMFIGQFPRVKIYCEMLQGNKKETILINGTLAAEAGDIYLIKLRPDESLAATVVSKSCVKLIETDY
ncbi:hypothetical protein [uncultured Roseibium sp.]|uniref:hypothetical protein n=1 Tax=uncultured Roseibium sp. TaxID=1936171 RepID=UPI002608BE8B|nr:hypothetical protein [uncultured Roseibium sp.]